MHTAVPTAPLLRLGARHYDLTYRALVMAPQLTPDSFYDKGQTFELDNPYRRAEQLVADGATSSNRRRQSGAGPEVTEPEKPTVSGRSWAGLGARLGTPFSVDTWRASVARARTPRAPRRATTSVAWPTPTMRRRRPSTTWPSSSPTSDPPPRRRPDPHYDDVVADVAPLLTERADGPGRRPGAEQIVLDAGLDLGKTAEQSLTLLRLVDLAGLRYPLRVGLNKTFLGNILDLELTERREAPICAAALGIAWGCRIVRVTTSRALAGPATCSPPSARPSEKDPMRDTQ